MANIISVDIDALTTAQGQLNTLTNDVESFQNTTSQLFDHLVNALAGTSAGSGLTDFDTHVSNASGALNTLNTALVSLNDIVAKVLNSAIDAAKAL